MKNRLEDNQVDKQMTELEREIRRISDDRDQQISRNLATHHNASFAPNTRF